MITAIDGYGEAWAFRWNICAKPGCYVVTLHLPGFGSKNFDAVMDDFGNLVKVEA